jgi:hypothetical protein
MTKNEKAIVKAMQHNNCDLSDHIIVLPSRLLRWPEPGECVLHGRVTDWLAANVKGRWEFKLAHYEPLGTTQEERDSDFFSFDVALIIEFEKAADERKFRRAFA